MRFLPLLLAVVCLASADDSFGDKCHVSSVNFDCGRELGCVDKVCKCCELDDDCGDAGFHECKILSKLKEMSGTECIKECKHKDLVPIKPRDWVAMAVVAICVMIAASAGIGGGGLIVPSFIFILVMPADLASPLSSVTITGGALANYLAFNKKPHPQYPLIKKSLIDYETMLLLLPALLTGVGVGAILDKVLPVWSITVLLFILLLALSIRTSIKAWKAYKEEMKQNKERASNSEEAQGEQVVTNTNCCTVTQKILMFCCSGTGPQQQITDVDFYPKKILIMMAGAWLITALSALLKGGKSFSSIIPNVKCGNAGYWLIFFGSTLLLVLLTVQIRSDIIKKRQRSISTQNTQRGSKLSIVRNPSLGDEEPLNPESATQIVVADGNNGQGISVQEDAIPVAVDENSESVSEAAPAEQTEGGIVLWNERNTIVFPFICLLCGICAGMLGIGGGMVVGPLLVELGLHPKVVAATSAFAVLVSASAATVLFLIMGLLFPFYSILYLFLGFFATLAGQKIMDALIRRLNLNSIIIIVIAFVTIAATCALGYRSITGLVQTVDSGSSLGFRDLCSEE
eukprot:TRINITY_DN11043_c1_g1_i1.p1 TRINITY_DN11043_c1_g1~~TRINITY_DN11043_c1_g1_i1.p1  ORF type:complete len:593 (+),score=81.66 TRINITY_DN11043_c1_g1_i1:65-1780(+)